MVTYINKVTSWEHPYMEYRGLSTDTKPTDAPINAKFVELDTGASFYFYNGTWNTEPTAGSASGGGLPADFPAEGIANANKYIGFDANGDYEAKSAPSGGAEKFVVTLTQDTSGAEPVWVADDNITIADVIDAAEDGKDVVVSYAIDVGGGMSTNYEIPLVQYLSINGAAGVVFSGITKTDATEAAVFSGFNQGTGDEWTFDSQSIENELPSFTASNNGQVLGVSSGSLSWVTPESGVSSWNDLTDKPFYEETVSVAINYTNPYGDGTNADKVVNASYLNTSVPISLYRVGDALTAAQLDGATMDFIFNDGTDARTGSITLTSANITSVQNGRYFAFEGLPFLVVADVDGTTIEIPNFGQFTSLDAGTYLEYIDMGNFFAGSYYNVLSITKDGVTVIHKLDEKFYNGGVSSWNDLEDRPFYEATTAVGFDYSIDLDDSYVSGYIHLDASTSLPCRFYRVSDPLTAEQLIGATVVADTGDGINSIEITATAIHEIEDNDEIVALFVCGEGPTVLVVNADNTAVNTTAEENVLGLSGEFASAGTYLLWIDLSVMEPDAVSYIDELYKEDITTVVPLPDQYYNPSYPVIIRSTDNGYAANRSIENILDAYQNGKHVYALIDLTSTLQMICPLCGIEAVNGIGFYGSMQIDNAVYAVTIAISVNDGVAVEWSTWACSVSSASNVSNALGGS